MTAPEVDTADAYLTLLDWRRRVADLYAGVRAELAGDPQGAHARWAAERDRLFGQHPQSPLSAERRAGFSGLPLWPYDPALSFTAPIEALPHEHFVVQTSAGHDMPLTRFGQVTFALGSLDVYWIEVYGGGVFLPFRDATSGLSAQEGGSYGGGRYLLDTVKSADLGSVPGSSRSGGSGGQELRLDFNFAYHPSCFYDSRWSCPLAPPANRLSGPVRAGERA